MSVVVVAQRTGTRRYPARVPTRQPLSITDVRLSLAKRVELAQGDEQAVHTVVLVDAQPAGVLVSWTWRQKAADALEEPLSLATVPVVAVTDLRDRLGTYVGTHVIVARRTTWIAALVPWHWYVRAATALGEPANI